MQSKYKDLKSYVFIIHVGTINVQTEKVRGKNIRNQTPLTNNRYIYFAVENITQHYTIMDFSRGEYGYIFSNSENITPYSPSKKSIIVLLYSGYNQYL